MLRVATMNAGTSPRGGCGADCRSAHTLIARIAATVFLLALPVFASAVGSTHRYTYDAAGNIVAIKNVAAEALTFTSFSPANAAFLASVTLSGSGFSPVATENVVSFNGTLATVVSATSNTLVVTVPTNASTGRISVSVGSAIVTHPSIFVVDTSSQAPTITSFSPAIVTPGTVVTLHGANYDPVASNDTVTFNSTSILPSISNSTQMTGTVPAALSSGKITVSTVYGTAVSATDLVVVPSGYSASAIGTTPRTTIDGTPAPVSIPVGKVGLVLFDAVQGENVSLGITNLVTSPANTGLNAILITPTGATVQIGQHCGGSGAVGIFPPSSSCYLSTLSSTGTYTLLFSSASTTATTFTVSLTKEVTSPLTTASQAVSLSRAAQSERLTFVQNEKSTFTVEVAGITVTPSTATLYGTLYDPDGNAIQTLGTGTGGLVFHVLHARIHGTYTVFLQADSGATVSAQAMLDTGVNLPVDGLAATINTTLTGQPVKYTFNAAAGQNLGLAMNGLTLAPTTTFNVAGIVLYNPDGSANSNIGANTNNYTCFTVASNPTGCGWDLPNLPQTGIYTLFVIPGLTSATPTRVDAATMNATVTLSTDASPPLLANTPIPITLRAGQNERLSVNATAGQPLAVEIAGIATAPSATGMTASLYAPNGSLVQSLNSNTVNRPGGFLLYVANLSVSGTYTVVIGPNNGASGSATVTLDNGTALSINLPTTLNTTLPGQSTRFNFSVGTAGQNVTVALAGLAMGPYVANTAGSAAAVLFNPDGTRNGAVNGCYLVLGATTSCAWNFNNLAAGTYSLLVMPGVYGGVPAVTDGLTMNVSVAVSAEIASTLTAATPVPMNLASPGQSARITFAATAGMPIAVEVTGIAPNPASEMLSASLLGPNGSAVISSVKSSSGGMLLYVPSAASTGTYTLLAQFSNAATGSAQVTLDAATSLPTNGTPVNFSTASAGQSRIYQFAGTAGQSLTLHLNSLAMTPAGGYASVMVYGPTGTLINSSQPIAYAGATGQMTLSNLSATGTYTLLLFPGYAPPTTTTFTMSGSLSLQ